MLESARAGASCDQTDFTCDRFPLLAGKISLISVQFL